MKVIDYLFLLSGLQSILITSTLFFYQSKKKHVNRYLGLFFTTICVELAIHFVIIEVNHPAIYYQPFRFDFLSMNFLFFYAVETTSIYTKRKLYYYIPAIVEFLLLLVIFIAVLLNPDLDNFFQEIYFDMIIGFVASIYIVVMAILVIKVNIEHRKRLPHFYEITKYKSLDWLTVFCIVYVFFNIVSYILHALPNNEYVYVFFDIGYLFFLYYITIASLVQINIMNVILPRVEEKEVKEKLESVVKIIEKHMLENKAYLNPSISLKVFAKDIKLPERLISKAINKIEHKNFNNYINYYRVEEFKQLLSMDRHKKFSISAIANEAGFNSRASFYKNFKDIVGVSPLSYVNNINI
jgi:AraC-like DNA-binding protein